MVKRKVPAILPGVKASLSKDEDSNSKRRKTSKLLEATGTGAHSLVPMSSRPVTRNSAKAALPPANSGLNPLEIDHILDKIFQHIVWPGSKWPYVDDSYANVEDLKNVRLVCKQWSVAATLLYRRGRNSTMFGNGQAIYCTRTYDLKMQNFLDCMKNSFLMPVQRYTIGANFFVKQNQRLMKDFMRICGPSATELRLYFDNSSTMNFTRRSFPDLNLSRLKSLLLNCGNYRGRNVSSQAHEIPYLVEVILAASVNLREFRFEFPPKDIKWQHAVVRRFADIISLRIPVTVKILRLDMWLNDTHLNTLAGQDLKLEEFQFDCHCHLKPDTIRKFLTKQSGTLKSLKIFNSDPQISNTMNFPCLSVLQYMELQGQGSTICPFSYPNTFPKIKILHLTDLKSEKTIIKLLDCQAKSHSLKEIFLPVHFLQAPLIRRVGESFPYIKTVHIAPSSDIWEALQETFVHLVNLEELYVTFPFLLDTELNVDSLFSGVSELDCRRILKHRSFDNVNVKDVQKQPSITNLTRLKKLVLDDCASDVILTDFSAHFVFMKMDSLEELHTSRFRMSSHYVEMLRNKLKLKLTEDEYSEYNSDDSYSSDDGWHTDSSDAELEIVPFLGFGFNLLFIR